MAHIEDRWYKTIRQGDQLVQVPKTGHGKGMRYRVRYLAPDGRERSESFPDRRKREAQAFLARIQADIHKGVYIDPDASKTTFHQYAEQWLDQVTGDPNRRDRLERGFRLHVYPTLGHRTLGSIQPSTIRAWSRSIDAAGLAASYQRNLFADTASVFNAAVDDKLIPGSPFAAKTVRPPRYVPTKVTPWTMQQRSALLAVIRDRYRVTVDLGAGCGLRQGEIFGASPDDITADRNMLRVVRQVKLIRGQLVFAAPKGSKEREVPLPSSVRAALDAHTQKYPPVEVTLPWDRPSGKPVTVALYLTTDRAGALHRHRFNDTIWRPAIRRAGIEASPRNGMHALRHTYGSVLLDAGESIKALSLYLGHSDPGFTLRIYTHLMPSSEDRTRRAIDKAFGHEPEPDDPDGLGTA
jgi:integrase